MTWLIDGYNLLFAHPRHSATVETRGLEAARRGLIEELAAFASGEPIEIVFDGARLPLPTPSPFPSVVVIFSKPGQTADDRILERVDRKRKRYQVVTSDRLLADELRHRGVKVVAADELVQRLRPRPGPGRDDPVRRERNRRLDQWEIDYWKREFGFDSE